MKRIDISTPKYRNTFAIVDDDFIELSNRKWYAQKSRSTFYAVRKTGKWPKRSCELMHRAIMDAQKGQQVDHRNGNGLDNRRFNLRFCTCSQNARNGKSHKDGTSRFRGVSWNKRDKKWHARIRLNYRQKHLGYFTNEIDAAKAYDQAAVRMFGEFAKLNFHSTSLRDTAVAV